MHSFLFLHSYPQVLIHSYMFILKCLGNNTSHTSLLTMTSHTYSDDDQSLWKKTKTKTFSLRYFKLYTWELWFWILHFVMGAGQSLQDPCTPICRLMDFFGHIFLQGFLHLHCWGVVRLGFSFMWGPGTSSVDPRETKCLFKIVQEGGETGWSMAVTWYIMRKVVEVTFSVITYTGLVQFHNCWHNCVKWVQSVVENKDHIYSILSFSFQSMFFLSFYFQSMFLAAEWALK